MTEHNISHIPSFIEALHEGKINIAERTIPPDSEFAVLSKRSLDVLNELWDTFTPQQKDLYNKLSDLENQMVDLDLLDRFLSGFRLGGQCVYDIFFNTAAPLSPDRPPRIESEVSHEPKRTE